MLLYIGIALCIIGAILVIYAVVKSTDGVDNNGASQLPAWAIGLSLKQYQKLLLEVQHYFTNRQLTVAVDDGFVIDVGDEHRRYELTELLPQLIAGSPRSYRNLITSYFDTALQANYEIDEKVNFETTDFQHISQLLVVVLEKSNENFIEKKLIMREDLPGLSSLLTIQLATSQQYISSDDIQPWGKTVDELFAIALVNLKERYPVDFSVSHQFAPGISGLLMTGEQQLIAGHALLLPDNPQAIGKFGSLLSVPSASMLMIYPINQVDIDGAVKIFSTLTSELAKRDLGSISKQIFWYVGGKYYDIPYQFIDEDFSYTLPEKYHDVTAALQQVDENSSPA